MRSVLSLLLLFTLSIFNLHAQENSILAQGTWVKMKFSDHGVFKLDRTTLSQMGFDINTLDPRNLQVFGMPGGMLPQTNNSYESLLLEQVAIHVEGEADGQMGPNDFILLYVDRVNELRFTGQTFEVTKNLYADEVFYFLTIGSEPGRRLSSITNLQGDLNVIDTYNRIISHEEDLVNILGSGREWFGEQFNSDSPLSFTFDKGALASNQPALLSFTGMAQSFSSSSFELEFNGQNLSSLDFNPIPDRRYGIKGNERSRVYEISSQTLSSSSDLSLAITYNRNGASNAVAYLNSFLLDLPTRLIYQATPFNFRSSASLSQTLNTFQVQSQAAELNVWDVSDSMNPQWQEVSQTASGIQFGAFSDQLHEYVVFNTDDLPLVTEYESLANQNISGNSVPDMAIVTHSSLLSEATRLAAHRSSHDGLNVTVVTIDQIYNEFSAGRQDISAIRNYARYLKNQDDRFQYLLLFGKGSYDYKNHIDNNTNLVPTYEARNSVHPLLSFSSDDYFGFLDEEEGLWAESASGDHLLDIGIGRIPATTLEQARTAVDKIISYQTDPAFLGDWRSRLVFVADDGDRNIHQRDADLLATLIDTTYTNYNITKLYLDTFEQEVRPNGEFSPAAVNALLDAVDKGALIINFTGHGAETGWMQERVLTTNLIDDWDNERKLPLLVTATCEFGRNDDPTIFSGAEKMIFKPDGGALALVTTARPVFSSTNYDLNLALYGSILESESGQYPRLGDIIQFTKNNSLRGSLNRNFILLGDPSMRIAYPENEVSINSINGKTIIPDTPDTIRALQLVKIEGAVQYDGQVIETFNGLVNFNLLDKSNLQQTKGTESEVFEFLERNSTLFSGSASVSHGRFEIEFVVPKNIDYQFGAGKMTFYAVSQESQTDALGASIDFVIGGTDEGGVADNTPPTVRAFLNDTSEVGKYFIKPDANLVLLLEDENGINVSQSGIGQDITATLNDSVTYILNDFYTTSTGNFRRGLVDFPIRDLPSGENVITIKVWDTHNNVTNSRLEFIVTSENSATISEINAYPNPFSNNMTFAVTHDSAGQSVEFVVEIFNQKGEKVRALYQVNPEAGNVEMVNWNGTDNTGSALPGGIYIYNILLRSENSEIVHSSRQKLIISN